MQTPEDAPLNEDIVEELGRSRDIVGELLPVIVDQKGRVINGRHRLEAGWRSKVVWNVKDDRDYALKRLHFLGVQRQSTISERAEAIGFLCQALEADGLSGKALIDKVLEESPWGTAYTYEFIPNRYKRSGGYDRAPRQGRPELHSVELEPVIQDKKSGVVMQRSTTPLGDPRPVVRSCPNCHVGLRVGPDGSFQISE